MFKINAMRYLDFNKTFTTDNYPYGFKKATAHFSLEFQPKKGVRSVFSSIDPKSGRENKPKKGNYYPLLLLTEADNGHFEFEHFDVNGRRAQIKTFKKLADKATFAAANIPQEVHQHLLMVALSSVKIGYAYTEFSSEEQKQHTLETYYKPLFLHFANLFKTEVTADDYSKLADLINEIPLKSDWEKKDFIIDNNIIEGEETVVRKQLNAMSTAELNELVSNWKEKQLAQI